MPPAIRSRVPRLWPRARPNVPLGRSIRTVRARLAERNRVRNGPGTRGTSRPRRRVLPVAPIRAGAASAPSRGPDRAGMATLRPWRPAPPGAAPRPAAGRTSPRPSARRRTARPRRRRTATWQPPPRSSIGASTRPPSSTCSNKIAGKAQVAAVIMARSNGPPAGSPRSPSAARIITLPMPQASRSAWLCAASSGMISMPVTWPDDPTSRAITAASQPDPEPISSTRWPGSSPSRCSRNRT